MHDDPVVYAIKDKGNRLVDLPMMAMMMLAHSVAVGKLL